MIWNLVKQAAVKTGLDMFSRLAVIGHQLWHEVTATMFLLLGLAAIPSTIKLWRTPDMRSRAVVASAFVIIMVYFGITSFMRAKRVGKQS